MFRGALRLLLAAALCAAPALARADVYRWVDDTGATHYATSRAEVPGDFRDAAEVIKAAPSTVPNPSSARPPAPPRPPAPAAIEPPPPAQPAPSPAPAPALGPQSSAPRIEAAPPAASREAAPAPEASAAPAVAPPAERAPLAAGDPRQQEIAQLEAAIERDREELRQLISTPRWDASELASDPHVREIAERLPRLQAELAALRTEAER